MVKLSETMLNSPKTTIVWGFFVSSTGFFLAAAKNHPTCDSTDSLESLASLRPKRVLMSGPPMTCNEKGGMISWLVVEPYPSEKDEWVTVGMMTFPTEWKNKSHVPNHQAVIWLIVGLNPSYKPNDPNGNVHLKWGKPTNGKATKWGIISWT